MDAYAAATVYDALSSSNTLAEAKRAVERFVVAVGHEHFICDFFSRDEHAFKPFAIHNYSDIWLERSARIPQSMYDRDPVFAHINSSPIPFIWSKRDYEVAGVAEVWEEAAAAGLGAGIAVSLECSRSVVLRVGLSRDAKREAVEAEAVSLRAHLLLFATCLKARTADLVLPQIRTSVPSLTHRELDALRWTKEGKTAWELGVILGISPKTANFHLQNAQRKLESTDKHQAVLRAIACHLID